MLLLKSPVKRYFIFREILIWVGVTIGSSIQSDDSSLVTQKVYLLTPVPLGYVSGLSYPAYYPPSATPSAI